MTAMSSVVSLFCLLVLSPCPHEPTSRDLSIVGNDRGWALGTSLFFSVSARLSTLCLCASSPLSCFCIAWLHCILHSAFCILHSAMVSLVACPHACIVFYVYARILLATLCCLLPLLSFFISLSRHSLVTLPSLVSHLLSPCPFVLATSASIRSTLPYRVLQEVRRRAFRNLGGHSTAPPVTQNMDTLEGKGEARSDSSERRKGDRY